MSSCLPFGWFSSDHTLFSFTPGSVTPFPSPNIRDGLLLSNDSGWIEGYPNHSICSMFPQVASSSIIVYDHEQFMVGGKGFILDLVSTTFRFYPHDSSKEPGLSFSCLHFFKWQGWTGLIACIIAETWIMGTVVGSVNGAHLNDWPSIFELNRVLVAKAIKIPGGTFCMPGTVQTNFFIFWIPMLAFECLLCGLALFRGFQTFRSEGTLYQNGRHLVGILIRDSILYFLVICTTYTTCLLVWIIGPTSLLEVPVGFSVAMSCVLANRVVFNVREVNRDIGRSENTSQQAMGKQQATWASFCSPGCLTQFEIDQLRSMRVELDGADLEDYSVDLPFVVL
ncbi:uncharacterized protein LACBIDRAFT_294625 [Laccaria bicolor S238N-H82]|uniref:Predicted protein n=1 Tax=Laccaria bicolor (strain S238N-H82 / ATCC MYA-4686) TaxID=486041 RepID=B0DFJ3_LACBS|nr:uncharacterized protein LACBIDRAFT_294625 [Laccaria bicolor S238N-H82]EDR06874.1 predicted protein [Laccaria bicolor S238N-H82]|eukprot:XP_001882721.1 predicted protein [Laccaria bicolor S238N-H82]